MGLGLLGLGFLLSLIVVFVIHFLKYRQALLRRHAAFAVDHVHPYAVAALIDALQRQTGLLRQSLDITNFFRQVEVAVKERAAFAVHAVADCRIVKLRAQLCLIIRWLRLIALQLFLRMSEATLVSKAARAPLHHIPAHLRLELVCLLLVQFGRFFLSGLVGLG